MIEDRSYVLDRLDNKESFDLFQPRLFKFVLSLIVHLRVYSAGSSSRVGIDSKELAFYYLANTRTWNAKYATL